jgi:hypothetical protein
MSHINPEHFGSARRAGLLAGLRGEPTRRPRVDPGLAGGLREWLEDELAPLASRRTAPGAVLKVDRRMVSDHHPGSTPAAAEEVGLCLAQVRNLLVGTLFRQLVTTGRIDHPLEDALAGLMVTGRGDAVSAFLASQNAGDRNRLRRQLVADAAQMARHWPALAPAWLPRTAEHLAIPLAGGRIVLSGFVDLVIGTPSKGRASVCLVDLAVGPRRGEQQLGLRFLALLETLRSGAAPARVATFDPTVGEVAAEDVTEGLLCQMVDHVVRQTTQAVQSEDGPTASVSAGAPAAPTHPAAVSRRAGPAEPVGPGPAKPGADGESLRHPADCRTAA